MLVGILAFLAGLVWIGQGLGYLTWTPSGMKPSFMIGDMTWTWIGAVLALVGLILIFRARGRGDMRGRR
jgi:hypothetical protein